MVDYIYALTRAASIYGTRHITESLSSASSVVVRVLKLSISKSALIVSLAGTAAILPAANALWVQDEEAPQEADRVLFEADFITRKDENSPVVATGNVQAYYGDRFVTADQVVYDPKTDIAVAKGNVAVTQSDGQTFFADEVELTGDLANGIASEFSAILAGDARIAGTTVVKNGDRTNELNNAVYTGCKVCKEDGSGKTPTWQVKARKVVQDREDKVIRFNNALVEMFGVPVFYTPYLQAPDPSVERQSGLLTPSIGNSSRLGFFADIPYYFAISDYQDATFSPKFMQERGILLKGEYRIKRHNGEAAAQAGFIGRDDDEILELKQRIANDRGIEVTEVDQNFDIPDFRFHFFAEATQKFAENWEAFADIDYVSDKFYTRSYDIDPEGDLKPATRAARADRFAQKLGAARRTDNSLLKIEGINFQSLSVSEDDAYLANALPRISYTRDFDNVPILGGNASLEANVLSLIRRDGLDTLRGVLSAQWERSHITRGGHKFDFFGELRGDVHRYEDVQSGNETCNASVDRFAPEFRTDALINSANARLNNCLPGFPEQGQENELDSARILPTVGAKWSYPLSKITENATFIIEPKVQVAISPNEDFSDEIINEDSQSFQLDTTSLYDWNKTSGYDFWEDGQRANIGIAAAAAFNNGIAIQGEIGQQFRIEETEQFDNYGLEIGLGGTSSDIVGALDLNWNSNLSFKNSFQIDEESGDFRRIESTLNGRYGKFSGAVNYRKFVRGDFLESENPIGIESLTAGAAYKINDKFSARYSVNHNLEIDEKLRETFGLVFQDECTRIILAYENDFTSRDGFETDRSISINIELLGLGN
jgi:LPS-assembly protein